MPLRPRLIANSNGRLAIEQDRPRIPAIFHREVSELGEDSRMGGLGEAFDGDDADVTPSETWCQTANKILGTQQVIQIERNVRTDKRVVYARDRSSHKPKLLIVDGFKTKSRLLAGGSSAV